MRWKCKFILLCKPFHLFCGICSWLTRQLLWKWLYKETLGRFRTQWPPLLVWVPIWRNLQRGFKLYLLFPPGTVLRAFTILFCVLWTISLLLPTWIPTKPRIKPFWGPWVSTPGKTFLTSPFSFVSVCSYRRIASQDWSQEFSAFGVGKPRKSVWKALEALEYAIATVIQTFFFSLSTSILSPFITLATVAFVFRVTTRYFNCAYDDSLLKYIGTTYREGSRTPATTGVCFCCRWGSWKCSSREAPVDWRCRNIAVAVCAPFATTTAATGAPTSAVATCDIVIYTQLLQQRQHWRSPYQPNHDEWAQQ